MKIHKSTILLVLALLSSQLLFAQRPGGGGRPDFNNMPAIGKISGQIIDSLSNAPVEFATISIFRMRNDSLVSGAVTNTKGRFLVEELKPGMYKVKMDFIGYQAKTVGRVMLGRNGFQRDLGKVLLAPSATDLGTVEVTADKAFMQTSIDKKVFNVERSLTSEGNTANEVLETIPAVDVDIDGNVSLRGSGNVTVLIDGRPSGLTGASRAAVLEQIPSSSIESVEVITNPSAKYNPDGMAGIINIVLKKNRKKGLSGNVTVGKTIWNRYNASASLNYRTSKFNFFSNYGFRHMDRPIVRTNFRKNWPLGTATDFIQDTVYLDQTGEAIRYRSSHMLRTGIDLYLNPKNTLTISGMASLQDRSSEELNRYEDLDVNQAITDLYYRSGDEDSDRINYEGNIIYAIKLKKPKQELTFDFNYSGGNSDEMGIAIQRDFRPDGSTFDDVIERQNTLENSSNQVITAKADYVHPLTKKSKFETGYQTIARAINKDFYSETYDPFASAFIPDVNLINEFLYQEQIHAVYGTYANQIKKFGIQAGLRLEQALTDSELITTNEQFENNYFSFFPTLHLSQKLEKQHEISWSYSRRINRPSFRSLNPFNDFSDSRNIRRGNPFLQPEYIHSIEFGHRKRWQSASLMTELFYKRTQDAITRTKIDTGGVSITTYANLNTSSSYGFTLIGTYQPYKWWDMNASFNLFRTVLDGSNLEGDLTNDGFGYSAKLTSSFKLWKGSELQLMTRYRGPWILAQGESDPFFTLDAAFKQKFWDNKASVSLRLRDVFDTQQFSFFTSGTNFEQASLYNWQSRLLSLSFSYNFGKQEWNKRRRGASRDSGGDMDDGF